MILELQYLHARKEWIKAHHPMPEFPGLRGRSPFQSNPFHSKTSTPKPRRALSSTCLGSSNRRAGLRRRSNEEGGNWMEFRRLCQGLKINRNRFLLSMCFSFISQILLIWMVWTLCTCQAWDEGSSSSSSSTLRNIFHQLRTNQESPTSRQWRAPRTNSLP